jgi:hypothetical protein
MTDLVHMARTKAEKKADKDRYKVGGPGDGEDYGYGLTVRLNHEHLKKLGITKMPKAGDMMHLHAKAHVKSTSEHSEEGSDRRHIELELRHMAVKATQRAKSEGGIEEGNLHGAKAAMDQALDQQEKGGKGKGGFISPEGDED